MIWVGWRQQRSEALLTAAMLAALTAVLLPTGLHIAAAYDHGHLARCIASGGRPGCDHTVQSFVQRFRSMDNVLGWLTLVPGLIGVLLAAPLITQFEQGTYRLDWTQGITRRRWIAGKLGVAIATTLAAALILTLLVVWWRGPLAHFEGRINNQYYDSEGTVPLAYALFALGLGLAIGVVWRRAVPALVAAFAGYFALRLLFDTVVRQHLVAPLHGTFSARGNGPGLARAWVLREFPSDAHGHPALLPQPLCTGGTCRKPADVDYVTAVYHPASHFWALQLRETALFTVAGLVLLGFAAWWSHQRVE